MLLQRECRWMEAFHLVAIFAPVKVRSAGELLRVCIFMAIQTRLRRGVIIGVETGRNMALRAGHSLVLAGERVLSRLMAALGKCRGLPSCIEVTGAAFAVIGTAYELPLMLVLVAVHALVVLDRLLEIGVLVARVARQSFVLAA